MKRLIDNYRMMFEKLPKEYHPPLDKDLKPELDKSELLGSVGVQHFQSLIGAVQWFVSLCRFNIAHACMSLGRFRAAP